MLSQSSQGPFTGDIGSADALHRIMKYIPYNRRTLTTMRCVSKPYRSAVQSPSSPWANNNEIILSRYGQCILFNATEDEQGRSNFRLYSISPIGRKFRTMSAQVLNRYHALVANGLTRLALHNSQVDNNMFSALVAMTNLKELELVSCRFVTSVGDAKLVKNLESLEVAFCPLDQDGVQGLALPHLKRLVLRSCGKLCNFNGIDKVTAASLEELHIENCSAYDDTCDVLLSHVTNKLHTLHLSSTHVDSVLKSVPEDARREGLVTLHLGSTPFCTDTFEAIAPSLEKLEFLSVENCEDLKNYEPLKYLKALRFLDISNRYLEEDEYSDLGVCEQLENIELLRINNTSITNLDFVAALKKLRVLDATSCSLTDASLMHLEGLPLLDTVVVGSCLDISSVNILHTCPNIRRIFCSRTSVDTEGITRLVECDKLEELDLKLTAVTNANFLVDCKALKIINVCSTVNSAEGIQQLLDKPGLEVICDSFDAEEFMVC